MDLRDAPRRIRPATIATAVLVAALLFMGIRQGALVLARPSFCASCHVMSAQYVSHRRSSHARAACVDCHSGRKCGSCHTASEADGAMEGSRVNAPESRLHETHGQAVAQCPDCHRGIMHSRMDGSVLISPWRSCGECHGQTTPGTTEKRHPVRSYLDMERQ